MVLAGPRGSRSWRASTEDVSKLPFGVTSGTVEQGGSGSMSGRSRWTSNQSFVSRRGMTGNNNNSLPSPPLLPPLTKSREYSDFSSNSSLESSRTRSREQSSSREHLLSSTDGSDGIGAKTENLHSWRSKFAAETRHQQSPTISIIQIKLEGDKAQRAQSSARQGGVEPGSRSSSSCSQASNSTAGGHLQDGGAVYNQQLPGPPSSQVKSSVSCPTGFTPKQRSTSASRPTVNPKEIEKITSSVNVLNRRQKFEGAAQKKKAPPEPPTHKKSVKESWDSVREKHCPVTDSLVKGGNGESLRSSILVSENKISFRNIKFKKATHVTVGGEEIKLKEVTSTKAFEDRATAILTEMRKQRRSLQLEYVAKVSVPTAKKISGWRDKLNRSDSLKAKEDKEEESEGPATGAGYLGAKRNSVTQLASKIKRKLSFSKLEVVKADDSPSWRSKKDTTAEGTSAKAALESPSVAKNFNPLDFILMKEDFLRKNPPPAKKPQRSARERSVESDSGETSMASVMDSLKKIVKAINPKREFPSDILKREKEEKARVEAAALEKARLREEILEKSRPNTWSYGYTSSWEVRMRKYQMGANMPNYNKYNSRWNSMQDLRIEPETKVVDKKAVRERIQNKVLSSVHQAIQNRIDDVFLDCDIKDFSEKGLKKVKPLSYKTPLMTFQQEVVMVLECVEYRKRELVDIIAHFSKDGEQKKRKSCHLKPKLHGTERGGDMLSFALINRTNAPWETVKPFNVAVKKKTELFDKPQNAQVEKGRARVAYEPAHAVVLTMSPGTCGTTAYCEQHKWDNIKACALFSIVGAAVNELPMAEDNKRLVVSLPVEASLGDDEGKSGEQIFHKCERKSQSDLIKDVISGMTGSLSRITFHYPATFTYYDTVMTVCRFLRTKKNIKKYKFKQDEVIARVIEGKSSDRRESSSNDEPFLSYGTV